METTDEGAPSAGRETVDASEARLDSEHGRRNVGYQGAALDARLRAGAWIAHASRLETLAREARDAADNWEAQALRWEARAAREGERGREALHGEHSAEA